MDFFSCFGYWAYVCTCNSMHCGQLVIPRFSCMRNNNKSWHFYSFITVYSYKWITFHFPFLCTTSGSSYLQISVQLSTNNGILPFFLRHLCEWGNISLRSLWYWYNCDVDPHHLLAGRACLCTGKSCNRRDMWMGIRRKNIRVPLDFESMSNNYIQ